MDDRTRRTVLAGLVLGMSLAAIDLLVVATAVPDIAGDLGNLGQVSWVFTAYLLTYTTSMLLYGRLGDVLGRKAVYQAAIATFVVSSVLAGASQSMTQLVIARALQGIGGGGLIALTSAVIADLVPSRERGRYAGLTSTVWAVCSLLGPLIGGLFVDHLSWRWIFFVNLPAGAAAFALVGAGLRLAPAKVSHRLDLAGSALLVAAVGCLLLVVTWGGTEKPWGSPMIVGLLAAGVASLIGFALVERRAPEPVLPTALFRHRVVAICSGATFLMGSANFGLAILLPVFLQVVNGRSATAAGWVIAPLSAGIALASTIVGRRMVRTGRYRGWPVAGGVVFAAGLIWLASMTEGTPYLVQLGASFVCGVGNGLSTPIFIIAVQNAVPHREIGTVTALSTFARSIGQAFGSALLGAVMAARLAHHLAAVAGGRLDPVRLRESPAAVRALEPMLQADVIDAFRRAITEALMLAVPLALAGAVVSAFLPHVPLQTEFDEATTVAEL